jgi:hypothetical protein
MTFSGFVFPSSIYREEDDRRDKGREGRWDPHEADARQGYSWQQLCVREPVRIWQCEIGERKKDQSGFFEPMKNN